MPPKLQVQVRVLVGTLDCEALRVCRTARQSSELPDEVRFLDRALISERPRSVAESCTRPCEGRRPGSTPGEDVEVLAMSVGSFGKEVPHSQPHLQ